MWKVGRHYGIQLAAYTAEGIHTVEGGTLQPGPVGAERLVVQLTKDGTYRLHRYEDPEDFDAFEDALVRWRADQDCARWRSKYRGTPDPVRVEELGL